MEIATLILPWCRDGNYGCLFDGTSNLSLTGKIAHFELGYIPESARNSRPPPVSSSPTTRANTS